MMATTMLAVVVMTTTIEDNGDYGDQACGNNYNPSKQSTSANVSLTSVQRQFNVELTFD